MSFTSLRLTGAILALFPALSQVATALSQPRLLGADNAAGQLLEIDPQTAGSTLIGPFSHPFVASLTWDSTNAVLYATTSDAVTSLLLRVDPNTGATTSVGPLGTFFMHGIEYNPLDDTLYGVASGGGSGQRLYRINRANWCAATLIASISVTGSIDIAFDPAAGVMYLAEINGQRLRTLNLTNGATTIIGPFNAPGMPFPQVGVGMAFDPVLGLFATDNTGIPGNPNLLYRIDTTTGAAMFVGYTSVANMLGLAFIPPVCPAERGDANCDGTISFFDIDPYLLALFHAPAYAALHCGGSTCTVDVNCDGLVNFFDVDPFVACLFGGCTPCP